LKQGTFEQLWDNKTLSNEITCACVATDFSDKGTKPVLPVPLYMSDLFQILIMGVRRGGTGIAPQKIWN